MKNTKKIISLVLAICMLASLAISASAANTVDASGGTGTSSVTLSSTADGSIGGDPAATKMSVTVPTVLPIAVGTDGTVSTATDANDFSVLRYILFFYFSSVVRMYRTDITFDVCNAKHRNKQPQNQ